MSLSPNACPAPTAADQGPQVTEEVERVDHCFRILLLQRDESIVWRDGDALRPARNRRAAQLPRII
jgi:hypothetical protein